MTMVDAATPDAPTTLVMNLTVPLHLADGVWLLEDQACDGMRRWLSHFDRLVVIVPQRSGPAPAQWVAVDAALAGLRDRLDLIVVPEVWGPIRFARAVRAMRPGLEAALARGDYLGFAIGGLLGDWGAVCAVLARRAGLPHFIWTDRVESEVTRRASATAGPWRRRLKARLTHRPMAALERFLIRGAALGLFHGRDTFDHYARFCRDPQIVHDIHMTDRDQIAPDRLAAKVAAAGRGPIRLCYVGRAEAMKGPMDWIAVLERAVQAGVDLRAEWLGDGAALAAMRARVAAGPLAGRVDLPGFVADRGAVQRALQGAHLFLFCHRTPESPRCLIEALKSGTPIIGHDGPYAADLIAANGGGRLRQAGDVAGLAAVVAGLDRDRAGLGDLMRRAAADGARYDADGVFAHRAALIRDRLAPARPRHAQPPHAPAPHAPALSGHGTEGAS